ncbi:MAG: dihydrofolate reductase family protein [Omnitrophica WOR_2 bacterium]
MRKLILFNMVTLDGFIAGPDGDIGWHNVGEEFNEYAIKQLDEAGGLLFGRVTYDLMTTYWPTQEAIRNDPEVANRMNQLPKVVFSRKMEKAGWQNTRLVKVNPADEVKKLKQQPGQDLFLFGSANLAAPLIQNDLIDEFRLMVNPVVLGSGIPEFQQPLQLKLLRTRPFQNGNVLLVYGLTRQ